MIKLRKIYMQIQVKVIRALDSAVRYVSLFLMDLLIYSILLM